MGALTALAMPAAAQAPSVTFSASTVNPGQPVQVTVANGPGHPRDWVAMYGASATDMGGWLDWKYLSGSRLPPATGLASAVLTFSAPSTPGTYNFRFFQNDTHTKLATSGTLTVSNPLAPTLTLSTATASPGEAVQVTAASGPGNPRDWVGLNAVSAADTSWLDWKYLNGTRNATRLTSAVLTFNAPSAPGTYNFRFFRDDTFTKLATSATLTVSPPAVSANATAASSDPLTAYSDEFDGSVLDPSWHLVHPELMTYRVENGSLVMRPSANTVWFNADEGPYVYKNISGNFKMTATVRARKASDPSQPVGSGGCKYGGLMIRNASSANENYIFSVVGRSCSDKMDNERKSTVESVSAMGHTTLTSTDLEIRVCRVGSKVYSLRRGVGSPTWILSTTYTRSDFPSTMQAGPIAYDYQTTTGDVEAYVDYVRYETANVYADCTGSSTTPDFTIGASPSSVSVTPGASANASVTASSLNGFNAAITLSASGLPSGVTASFAPNPVTPPVNGSVNSTLTFNASATATTGTFNVTVTGSSGSTTRSATVSLTVSSSATPNFTLSLTPTSRTVTRPGTGSYTVNINRINGFTGAVTFSVSPAGGTFSPNPATGNSSTLTFPVGANTPPGTYGFTVTGTSGSVTRTTTGTIIVQ